MGRALDLLTSFAATGARFGGGYFARGNQRKPAKLLELWEFEACPFCRKTREALTGLDLDAMIYPCPKGGTRFRPGKKMFPYLVDPNTGAEMYESMDIARYLAKTYGDGSLPIGLRLGPITTLSSMVSSAWRAGHGGRVKKSNAPEKPLELWSFETSPYCRLAREALCELEIPHVLHNVGKRSANRKDFVSRSGKMMVPYLVDDNTGKAMFESADIVRYLHSTYAVG
jgi:glutathione S-transferase